MLERTIILVVLFKSLNILVKNIKRDSALYIEGVV